MTGTSAGTILGLDVGEARIGLAQWDAARGARDAGVVRRTSRAEDARRIARIAVERGAVLIVVGLPRNLDGSEGSQARISRDFAATVRRAIAVPVELFDEYETTQEATAELDLGGRPLGERERGMVDARSATIILRRYVERRESIERVGRTQPEGKSRKDTA